ncbi:replication protein A 32 kDa subunit-like isoform X1 [Watersipora subatra]|uniref:replication protein A 32 kDa subunit-like isoform X1 n=1 Tax=Watersipora subatra TaxID=2589382 RepID=UPI00355B6869
MAWNDQSGGFESSPSVNASPRISKAGSSNEKNGMKPVCIKYIHRAFSDDAFTAVDGSPLQQVVILGKVLTCEMNNQRCDYKLADSSGATILAREYINDEDNIQPEMIPEGTYVTVYGTVKSFQGSPHLIISRIARLKDPNEITMHLLEMTHTYIKMTEVGQGDSTTLNKDASISEQVRTVVQGTKNMTGLSKAEIQTALPHFTPANIDEALNSLSADGFIFTTIDDDHFRATEDA